MRRQDAIVLVTYASGAQLHCGDSDGCDARRREREQIPARGAHRGSSGRQRGLYSINSTPADTIAAPYEHRRKDDAAIHTIVTALSTLIR